MRVLSLTPVLLALVSCSTSTQYYTPDPEDGITPEPLVGASVIAIAPADETELELHFATNQLDPVHVYPSLRFDLSAIPEGVVIQRAVLRLRRAELRWDEDEPEPKALHLQVYDVNEGLLIDSVWDWERQINIEAGRRSQDELALWRRVSDGDGGPRPGLELVGANYNSVLYIDLIDDWNASVEVRPGGSGPWDTIDVTDFVRSERAGDGSISLLLRSHMNDIRIRWIGSDGPRSRRSELPDPSAVAPYLLVEYDVADSEREPVPEP